MAFEGSILFMIKKTRCDHSWNFRKNSLETSNNAQNLFYMDH
jgi:hypothetical protein